jgi:hypothetical protein
MHYLAKACFAVAANVIGTLVVYAVLRSTMHIQYQAVIDYLLVLIGSTAHIWYMKAISWTGRIVIAVVSAVLIIYGMFTFVTAVLRDGT